jgi:very-short-patch-repair endonuclease
VNTPNPGPSPLQGEGGDAARPQRIAAGGVDRARRFRKEATLAERLLWEALRRRKMNFRRQAPIGRFVADCAHFASSLVIEIDGPFHGLPERQAADAARARWLNDNGYRVIRFPEKQVRDDLMAVVEQIVAATVPPPSPTLPPSRGKGAPRYDVR